MSIRLNEKYQTIVLNNGNTVYKIYNLEIISRLNTLSEQSTFTSQILSEKLKKRCLYRTLSFVDPQQHLFIPQLQQQQKNIFSSQTPCDDEHMIKFHSDSPMNSSKKLQMCTDYKNGDKIKTSQKEFKLESSNSDYSAMRINKKISKDTFQNINKQKTQSSSWSCYPPSPDSYASKGTSTQITISIPNRQSFPKIQLRPCLKFQKKQEENQSQITSQKDIHQICQQKIDREYEDGEEIRIDSDIEEEQEEEDCNLQQNTGTSWNMVKKINQQNDGKLIQKNNKSSGTNIIIKKNKNNNIYHDTKPHQLWSMGESAQINQKIGKIENEKALPGEYKSQITYRISIQSQNERENYIVPENKVSLNINSQISTNNSNDQINIGSNYNNHISNSFKILSLEYKMIPKNNTLKNIKKAFIRYLLKTNRKQLIKKCEQFHLDAGHILTVLCQEIKYDHRHNKNIRYLLKSELISPLFKDFLENSDDYWFSNSSLQNPGPCRQMVSLLLKISKNDSLIDVIQEYEK